MKSNRFIGNESNLEVPDMANVPNVQKRRSFLTSTFAKGAALLLAASVTLGGCPGPTDPSGGIGKGAPNGLSGNERVSGVHMSPNEIYSQKFATVGMTRILPEMLKQSQVLEAQYATLDGETADSLQAIEHNVSSTLQQTDRISTGRDSIPGYVTQMVDTLAPNTTNPDLFRKTVEAQRILMTLLGCGYTEEELPSVRAQWVNIANEINGIDPNLGLSPDRLPSGEAYLVPRIAGMIPAGENGAKFPEDLSRQMMDLYKFHSFTFALKNIKGFNIDVAR